jgi:transcriptional regulator with XRE-family HTH domain
VKLARLKEWREARGLTQKELSLEAGVGEKTIARIELGDSVRTTTARKVADALSVSVADLMENPPVPLAQALQGSGQPETAPPAEEEPTFVPQSAATLDADIELIKRLKKQHKSDLEKIRRGELDYDAVLRMEAVDEGVRARLEKRGVLRFAEDVKAHRELADDESRSRALLRELRYLEELTDEARALSARVTSDIHEEVEKGASQAESWISERHEQSS